MARDLRSKGDFEAMLLAAERERIELATKRDRLSDQISELDKIIESLRILLSPLQKEPPAATEVAVKMLKHAGLTDAVRMMLQSTEDYTTITQIVETLKSISYPIGRLENPRAALVVIMSRLVDRGDVERKETGKIEPGFRWTNQERLADRLAKQFLEAGKKK